MGLIRIKIHAKIHHKKNKKMHKDTQLIFLYGKIQTKRYTMKLISTEFRTYLDQKNKMVY